MTKQSSTIQKAAAWAGATLICVPGGGFLAYWLLNIPSMAGFQRQPLFQDLTYPVCALWMAAFGIVICVNWHNPDMKRRRTRRQAALAAVGVVMFSYGFTAISIPVLAYWAPGTPAAVESAVRRIERGSRRSRCNMELWTEFDPGLFSVLCISAEAAKRIRPGQRVVLSGRANAVALFVEQIRLSESLAGGLESGKQID